MIGDVIVNTLGAGLAAGIWYRLRLTLDGRPVLAQRT